MPSVMTMASGMRASMASITASLVRSAGTKMTDTSAPVAAMVSATVPNTGTSAPFSSTVWPALRGLVPPTTWVPAASIRAPCLRPPAPVMPWISTRLWLVRKIAISCSVRGTRGRQLGGPPGGIVHGRYLLDHADPGFVEDPAALGRVVAVQPHHDRVADLLAALPEHADRGHDAVGDRVAGGDAAEHVDEHAADRRVGQHDLQAVGHHLGRGAAADVEEVGGPHPPERLTGVGHHVQRGHDQAGAVPDDADLALELDVVEVLGLGLRLQRVGAGVVRELVEVLLLAERGVVVQRDLAVQRQHPAVGRQDH